MDIALGRAHKYRYLEKDTAVNALMKFSERPGMYDNNLWTAVGVFGAGILGLIGLPAGVLSGGLATRSYKIEDTYWFAEKLKAKPKL